MGGMAGYSGTPLPRKLGLREEARFAVVRAPTGFDDTLGALPSGVMPVAIAPSRRRAGAVKAAASSFDVIVCFVLDLAQLGRDLPALKPLLDPAGGLWVAWPKRTSGMATDVTEAEVRARGLATGLVDNKVCAIDDVWSGLRFVVRLADRPPPAAKR
jgi:hypothetical protein